MRQPIPPGGTSFNAEFEAWWVPNEPRYFGHALRYAGGDAGVARDALQAAGAYLWKRWQDYRPAPPCPVVFRIISHRVIDELRRRSGLLFPGPDAPEAPAGSPGPDLDPEQREVLANQRSCEESLPDSGSQPMRSVYELHKAGLEYTEIARRLGIPYPRARRLGMQANIQVRTCLIRRVCGQDAGFLALHQECVAGLEALPRGAYELHWQGQSPGSIARHVGVPEDRTLGLLEAAVESVLTCLIRRVFGG
jgi:DNA-directed RNA polymerase specialized sigma24 family protein